LPGGAGATCLPVVNTYNGGGVPIAIPDNNLTGVTLSMTVPDSYTISDLNLSFQFGNPIHTWYDDINMRLVHVDTGTAVLLMNGGGSDNSDLCGPYTLDDSAAITFDQAAANETTGTSCIPTGSFRPDSPLSSFNGEIIHGTWHLTVWDDANGDIGTLQAWSLSATNLTGPCVQTCSCRSDMNLDGLVNGKDISGFVRCLLGSGTNCTCADLNRDSVVTTADISLFVTALLAGACG
jgi:subtilisin-like proprotein convertase family protein